MTKVYEVYKCNMCGNIVEMLEGGPGELVCCDEKMVLLNENTVDAAKEKHVPVIESTESGIKVKVGSVPHPMEEKHSIRWIEVINGDYIQRKHLKPGDKPEAEFYVPFSDKLVAREYCNLHGHWKS